MSEYLIQGETMTAMADHMRRISGTEDEMTGAEILEIFSRTQGALKTTGEYKVEAINYDGTVLKSGNYDTGEVFAMPTPSVRDDFVFQDWTCTSPLNINYVEVESSDIVTAPIYALADTNKDTFMIKVNIVEPNTAVIVDGINFDFGTNIDFGDGVVGGVNDCYVYHTYSDIGNYTIKIFDKVNIIYHDDTSSSSRPLCTGASSAKHLIESVYIPSYITDINKSFFKNLTSLKEVVLHSDISTIRSYAFEGCTSLEYVFIPKSVTSFNHTIFANCTNLKKVVLPYGMTELTGNIFQGCTSLTNITIPNSVARIGNSAFARSGLTQLVIPSSVTTIGDSAFAYCSNLTNIRIPSSVTTIGPCTFEVFDGIGGGRNSLKTILLPSVTFLSSRCFQYRQFENVILLADEVCSTDGDIFYESNYNGSVARVSYFITGALYVPDSLVDAYKADSYWSWFSSVIKPYSEYVEE